MTFPFCEAATGSLGQGLSIGVGQALNAKYLDKLPYMTYVLLGDSEMAEGSQWEALQLAAHYQLDNLVGIIDVNRLGQRGETMYGHDLMAYENRIKAFGWETILVDGHGHYQILPTAMDYPERFERPPGLDNPITGGMGSISPHPMESPALMQLAEETIALGRELAPMLKQHRMVILRGDLGAGKTTLIRSLLQQLDPSRIIAAQLVSTQLDADSLLRAVATAFGLVIKDYDKARLLANGDRWEREIAKNLALDAPYR